MAICTILEDPNQSEDQAEQVRAYIRSSGPNPPEGARLVLAGPADAGWRVVTVWDSADARDEFFAERLTQAYEAAGLSLPATKRTEFDVQVLVAGDLTGAATA